MLYRHISIILVSMILISCGKTSTKTLNESVETQSTLKYSGNFQGTGGETVSGKAEIYLTSGTYMLKLDSFYTSNGPDLKVYLSKAATPLDYISLGDLKSTNGSQVYNVNATPDFTQYKYVLIHCERYNHLFGSALLK